MKYSNFIKFHIRLEGVNTLDAGHTYFDEQHDMKHEKNEEKNKNNNFDRLHFAFYNVRFPQSIQFYYYCVINSIDPFNVTQMCMAGMMYETRGLHGLLTNNTKPIVKHFINILFKFRFTYSLSSVLPA